jgi:hypothetical protein
MLSKGFTDQGKKRGDEQQMQEPDACQLLL